MDKFPLVSVLIPIYGVERYIQESLRSVLIQDYPNIEIILVNDASPDRSVALAEELLQKENNHQHTIKWCHHERNRGLAMARLTALQVAEGEYLLFLDSDDYWNTSSMVREIIAEMEEQLADLVLFNYVELRKNRTCKIDVLRSEDATRQTAAYLKGEAPAYLWNKCFRRGLFLTNAAVWKPSCNLWEDMHNVPLYTLGAKKIVYIDRYYLTYRRLPGSVSNSLSIEARDSVRTIHADLFQRFSSFDYKSEKECITIKDALEVNALLAHMIRLKTTSLEAYKEVAKERVEWGEAVKRRKGWSARWDAMVLLCNRMGCFWLGFILFRLKVKLIRMLL